MGYTIIEKIKIDLINEEVFIRGKCSNMTYVIGYKSPLFKSEYYSGLFKKEGFEAVEKDFLREYSTGSMQKGNNQYAKFTELKGGWGSEYFKNENLDNIYKDFKNWQMQAKRKFIFIINNLDYVKKITKANLFPTSCNLEAKVFSMTEEEKNVFLKTTKTDYLLSNIEAVEI